MRNILLCGLAGWLALAATSAQAQASLGASPYQENFDGLAGGLPAGFSVRTGATAASLGAAPTTAQLLLAPGPATTWASTGTGFKNYASATGLAASATTAAQTAAPNRALGVRQTSTAGFDPGAAFVFEAASTSGKTDFALSFRLQSLDASSPRVTTWRVDYGLGAAPTAFTPVGAGRTTGGGTFANDSVTVSFGAALDNQGGPITIRIVALAASTGSSNRPSTAIDDFRLSWSAPTATTPALAANPTALSFGNQAIGTTSASRAYVLTGANLTGATTVAATGPFVVAKDSTAAGGASLTYSAAELAAGPRVYVRFRPTAAGPAAGSISNASAGAAPRSVALTGVGIDPSKTTFDFAACTTALADGWTQYSGRGPQTWGCTTFGHAASADPTASAPYGVQINGYASGNMENEDWFISPAFDLRTYSFPLLSYWARTAFGGPALKLRVSTTYGGSGAPGAATWTDLNVQFPAAGSDVWTLTNNVNLSAFKGANVYVAFVYSSTTTAAARWTLDDIALTNSTTAPTPSAFTDVSRLAFGYVAPGASATRPLTVSANDLVGDSGVTLISSNPAFTLSKDGTTFASTLTLTPAEVNGTSKAVTVRFSPAAGATSYAASLSVNPADGTAVSVALSGDTYDVSKTLEVVNWNMEWFGSPDATLGPKDKDLQKTNASTVLKYLNADVFALEEVVDTVRLKTLVAELSAATGTPFAYKISDFGSYGDNASDLDYVGDQKLAFIYRTSVVSHPSFQGLLRCTQAQACAAWSAWASGRFPYLMSADVTLDGVTKPVNFIVIHAKANATATSANDYARRQKGADLLKNLLDTSYASANTLLVGDYNDVLEGTIATGVTPAVSSYYSFVQDSSRYVSLTLPLARAGLQSTASFKTVIDNVIANKNMAQYYLSGTAAIRTDAAALVPSYATTTSDHYPVYSRYAFTRNALATKGARAAALSLYPNPVTSSVRLEVPETGANLRLRLYTADGRVVLSGTGSVEQLNQQLNQRVAGLAGGLYLVRVVGAQQTYTARLQKQ